MKKENAFDIKTAVNIAEAALCDKEQELSSRKELLEAKEKQISERAENIALPKEEVNRRDADIKRRCEKLSRSCEADEGYGESHYCEALNHKSPFYGTVKGMLSYDFRERFIAEYRQLKIRCERLSHFLKAINVAKTYHLAEEPEHKCPTGLLKEQLEVMQDYLDMLERRAIIEGIEVGEE